MDTFCPKVFRRLSCHDDKIEYPIRSSLLANLFPKLWYVQLDGDGSLVMAHW